VEVVITSPPRPTPFADINDTEDEYEPSPSPVSQPQGSKSRLARLEVFVRACERCQKGDRDCVVGEVGAACVGCKAHKYKCDKTGQRHEKTMEVTRPEPDPEVEVVEERKGKKREVVEEDRKGKRRRAEATGKAKKAKEVKVKVEKVEKPKPKPTVRNTRAKAGVKTPAVVESSGAEDEPIVVDLEDSEEELPKTKRSRLMKGKYP
jgi:hypothetical protein